MKAAILVLILCMTFISSHVEAAQNFDSLHNKYMQISSDYRNADKELNAAWATLKSLCTKEEFKNELAEQRAWISRRYDSFTKFRKEYTEEYSMIYTARKRTNIIKSKIESYSLNSSHIPPFDSFEKKPQMSISGSIDIPNLIKEHKYKELENTVNHIDVNAKFKTDFNHVFGVFDTFANDRSENPLMCAIYYDDMRAIQILVKYGARITNPYETILPAAVYNSAGAFLYFYDKGLAKRCPDEILMYYVVEGGNFQLLKFLIEKGHKFNAKQKGLIHCAVRSGNIELLQFLIDNGADVNQQYNYEKDKVPFRSICGENPTPLDSCLEQYNALCTYTPSNEFNYDGAMLLLKNGANPFKTDTFFQIAQGSDLSLDMATIRDILLNTKNAKIPDEFDKFTYISYLVPGPFSIKKKR